ncbi:hypothetical protein N657DRAFT_316835 [Parathielavia appendiculata]|uniref:Uncharacterized protein n=1 Tax=Parathielavia appendiculata TaxID=2587402 RepID=A0AAN6YZ97_9PEZI|nr:hypothetical protein N657DRAFT_316835 [Parathielavia appendiculata]
MHTTQEEVNQTAVGKVGRANQAAGVREEGDRASGVITTTCLADIPFGSDAVRRSPRQRHVLESPSFAIDTMVPRTRDIAAGLVVQSTATVRGSCRVTTAQNSVLPNHALSPLCPFNSLDTECEGSRCGDYADSHFGKQPPCMKLCLNTSLHGWTIAGRYSERLLFAEDTRRQKVHMI